MTEPALKIFWLNPLTTTALDQPIADLIREIKLPSTEVHVASLDLGKSASGNTIDITNVEYRVAQSAIWLPVTQVSSHIGKTGFDGLSIGCFYDTALEEAREVSGEAVVIAPCQAALQTISNLSQRFSIIIGQDKWRQQMEDRVRYYGYHDRLASFRSLGLGVDDFQKDTKLTEERIHAAAEKAIKEDGAEGIILGCTAEFGFFRALQADLGCPVIDAVYSCFKATENAALAKAQFGWKPSRLGSGGPFDPAGLAATHLLDDPPRLNEVIVVK